MTQEHSSEFLPPAGVIPEPRVAAHIFECNCPLRVFGLRNNVLADTVILVRPKPTLATGQLTQSAFGRLSSDGLKGSATTSTTRSKLFNRRARMGFAIRIGGDVNDTQVNSQNAFNVDWFRFFDFRCWNQIPTALDTGKVALTDAPVEQLSPTKLSKSKWRTAYRKEYAHQTRPHRAA